MSPSDLNSYYWDGHHLQVPRWQGSLSHGTRNTLPLSQSSWDQTKFSQLDENTSRSRKREKFWSRREEPVFSKPQVLREAHATYKIIWPQHHHTTTSWTWQSEGTASWWSANLAGFSSEITLPHLCTAVSRRTVGTYSKLFVFQAVSLPSCSPSSPSAQYSTACSLLVQSESEVIVLLTNYSAVFCCPLQPYVWAVRCLWLTAVCCWSFAVY